MTSSNDTSATSPSTKTELFNVVQFLPHGLHEYLARGISAEQAMEVARDYIRSDRPGVQLGVIRRVIITDMDDLTVFDWRNGEGVVWPAKGPDGEYIEYGKKPPPWKEE
jgi:hypothetical protein